MFPENRITKTIRGHVRRRKLLAISPLWSLNSSLHIYIHSVNSTPPHLSHQLAWVQPHGDSCWTGENGKKIKLVEMNQEVSICTGVTPRGHRANLPVFERNILLVDLPFNVSVWWTDAFAADVFRVL